MTRVRFRITRVRALSLGLRRGKNSIPEEPQDWGNVQGQELQVCAGGASEERRLTEGRVRVRAHSLIRNYSPGTSISHHGQGPRGGMREGSPDGSYELGKSNTRISVYNHGRRDQKATDMDALGLVYREAGHTS